MASSCEPGRRSPQRLRLFCRCPDVDMGGLVARSGRSSPRSRRRSPNRSACDAHYAVYLDRQSADIEALTARRGADAAPRPRLRRRSPGCRTRFARSSARAGPATLGAGRTDRGHHAGGADAASRLCPARPGATRCGLSRRRGPRKARSISPPCPRRHGQRLERFVALLRHWQATHNLVSPQHARRGLDAACRGQSAAPRSCRRVLAPGSISAAAPGFRGSWSPSPRRTPAQRFILVESNKKKARSCALRPARRRRRCTVVAERDRGACAREWRATADIVIARALAPLADLLPACLSVSSHSGARLLLLKGQDLVQEVEAASKSWAFDLVVSPSVDRSGRPGRR